MSILGTPIMDMSKALVFVLIVSKLLSYDTYTTNTKPIKIGLVFVKAPSGGNSIQKHLPEILGRCLLHHQNLQR